MDHRGGYRGADLDLRTARTWSATSTDLMSGFEVPASPQGAYGHGPRPSPIWVDETVLAAANQAFELALAHGAREVQLEHLLNALTRIEAAIATLELRGVRVMPLRRESAILIASDIPVGLPAGGTSPRRSHELEETLRLAAAHAAQSGRPAGTDDILHVLVDLRGDHPAGELLIRHLPRATRDFWSPFGAGRAHYGGPAHLVEVPESERLHHAPGAAYLTGGQPQLTEASPDMLERLAGIERMLSERLSTLEAAITSLPTVGPKELQPYKDRLDLIEEELFSQEGDGAVVERLSALARQLQEERVERTTALAALADDVKALTAVLGEGSSDKEAHKAIAERLQGLVADLERHRIELGASLGDRIAALESTLAAQGEKAAEAHTAYSEELAEVHEALMKLNVNQHTLAGSLEAWRSNEAGEIHLINARIGAVQEDGTKRSQMLERLSQEMAILARVPAEEGKERRGFSQWLFGTEDWIKASWEKHVRRKA
jgi:hypothetical protein